jgi:hypothetical protein
MLPFAFCGDEVVTSGSASLFSFSLPQAPNTSAAVINYNSALIYFLYSV